MKSFQFFQLVLTKVQLNLKSEAAKSYLSYIWWLLEPTLLISVFYIVFGIFLDNSTEDFLTFLVCGHIPFQWFDRTLNNSANSLLGGRGIMNQIAVPKIFFPLVDIFQDAIKSALVMLLLLIYVIAAGYQPTLAWFAFPLLIITQLLLIIGISLVGAALVPFIPDIKFLISTVTLMMMFGSGIFYSYKDVILPQHQDLFLMNPLANLIRMYREMLMGGIYPDWNALFVIAFGSLLLITVVSFFYKKFGNIYPRLVLR